MAKTFDEVMERFRSITFRDEFDIIVAIANGGIVPAAIVAIIFNIILPKDNV